MASARAIATALALLDAARFPFAPASTAQTAEVYSLALSDVPDGALGQAVELALRQCEQFPPPAKLRALAGADQAVKVNATDVISKIAGLSVWMPNGYAHPSIPLVRDKLGAAAAEAYGYVGPRRLFSENETTRGIAERDFAQTFVATVEEDPRTALPRPSDRMLDGPIHPDLVKRLKAETSA